MIFKIIDQKVDKMSGFFQEIESSKGQNTTTMTPFFYLRSNAQNVIPAHPSCPLPSLIQIHQPTWREQNSPVQLRFLNPVHSFRPSPQG